jgi:hypothetical protein
MAHTGIFATSAEIGYYVPAQANTTTYGTEAAINSFCRNAESRINAATMTNWSDLYSSLNIDVKHVLTEMECCLVAYNIINGDKSGFFSEAEALNTMEALMYTYNQLLGELKKTGDKVSFIRNA